MTPPPARATSRVVVEAVEPAIVAGRYPVKRTVGEEVAVSADVYADGHEVLAAVVRHRPAAGEWAEVAMTPGHNDRWSAAFAVAEPGWHEYTVRAWIDRFAGWRRDLGKKAEAGQDVTSELLEGAELVRQTASRLTGAGADRLRALADALTRGDPADRLRAGLDASLAEAMARHADRSGGATYEPVLKVWVDRELARFGAWYELFPRSCADEPGRHGTFRDVERRLSYVAGMGFDVLYLPPIHPIGRAFRKGANNSLTAGPADPGSPWAIGGPEGGHKAVDPRLGTLADFDHLVKTARAFDIEIALDIAFQCSPDHPYVKEHPRWFRHRPDGTIKYAENPPKKYQDIYPLDFECDDWQNLWTELRSVFLFWADRGVRVFRVDNPHTKPFRFWEWLIAGVQEKYPDAIFLSEAFTRPKVMRHLAALGFTQSYTYFTWRNTKHDLTEYFTELTQTDVREYLRPNLFANTPDILHEYLQHGGPAAFRVRLILAATLGASYGIYGPPFENCVGVPVRPGSEEYLDSEKYQLRHWDWESYNPLRELIARVNQIRRRNPALQSDHRLRFYHTDNDRLLFYGKTTPDLSNVVLVAVNLDPHHTQSGWVRLPPEDLGLRPHSAYEVGDLLTGVFYLWHGETNFVSLHPGATAHVFRLWPRGRTGRDSNHFV